MKTALFVGAHVDDIESGAAGLLAKLSNKMNCYVIAFSDCEDQPRNTGVSDEYRKSMGTLGIPTERYFLKNMPNTKFPENSEKIRKILEKIRDEIKPDIIVTHDIENIHQDHKTVADECIRVFRNKTILMYEHVKSTPRFSPNLIISLTKEELDKKINALNCYETQKARYYWSDDFFKSLAKFRGKQMNVEFGEGFKIYQAVY